MKVSELLSESIGYDAKRKMPTGPVAEWLKAIGATKEDIAEARKQVLKSPEYLELVNDVGFTDTSGSGHEKRGSIELTLEYPEPKTINKWVDRKTGEPIELSDWSWEKRNDYKYTVVGVKPEFRTVRLKYTILPHGKIDFTAPNNYHRWPVPSGKTRVVPNKPVDSIVSSMRMALKDLLRQMANKMAKVRKLEDMIEK